MLDQWVTDNSSTPTYGSTSLLNDNQRMERGAVALGDIFAAEVLERNGARNHGLITSMDAGNNVIVVGTDRGWFVRHDFYSGSETLELDLAATRVVDHCIHRVFLDPGGRHALAVVKSSSGVDTHYIHSSWRKSRILTKLKGIIINGVAWNRQQLSDATTQEIVLGTSTGQLYETSIEEKDKREKPLKLLYEITELQEPFVSLQMETGIVGQVSRYFLMAVTPTRLYTFSGTGSLETVFAAYAERMVHFTELPGEMPHSEVHFSAIQRRFERFAWLGGAGIYHGDLNLSSLQSTTINFGEENFVENKALLEYSKVIEGTDMKPVSLGVTEFHFLILYANVLKVVNRINQKVIEEKQFESRVDDSIPMLGLCTDAMAGAVYAFDANLIYEILINDEGRDMWQVYLDMKQYTSALEHCRDVLQRDRIYSAQAEEAFASGDFMRAAIFYAKTSSVATFEEIALKFVAADERDALRTFLLRKLDTLGKEDRSQITMISTWAAELYLDKMNRLMMENSKQNEGNGNKDDIATEYQTILSGFRAFLSDCKDVLDEATTMKLLGSYGRVDELIFYASLKEQHEIVIHHYIQQGEAKKAISVLRKPSVSPELQYKFAAALIMLDPYETVEYWMTTNNLDPRRLIPALMRYSSEPRAMDEAHEAIKYLEFCIQRQQNEDSAVHNLLLSLYAKQEDESALLRFLDSKFGKGRDGIFYDLKYALRLCLKEKRMRACVYLYSSMGMHEEAVALALHVDPELAKAEADKVKDDPDLQKKLWLMVAKHVIQQEKGVQRENIRKAIAFMKETDGLLKIEDILPFFPDFALIDDFKEAICTSLEDYNKQIEQLKQEMNDATRGADNIRRDISALTQRYAIVDRDEKCGAISSSSDNEIRFHVSQVDDGICDDLPENLDVCEKGILVSGDLRARGYNPVLAPFYVFPCEHSFHAECLVGYVIKHSKQTEWDGILDLQHRISALMAIGNQSSTGRSMGGQDESNSADSSNVSKIDQLRAQLDDRVAAECPYCGELMINELSSPFISDEEFDMQVSWQINK